jgi:hypothetical protein
MFRHLPAAFCCVAHNGVITLGGLPARAADVLRLRRRQHLDSLELKELPMQRTLARRDFLAGAAATAAAGAGLLAAGPARADEFKTKLSGVQDQTVRRHDRLAHQGVSNRVEGGGL